MLYVFNVQILNQEARCEELGLCRARFHWMRRALHSCPGKDKGEVGEESETERDRDREREASKVTNG